jgi:signal transduction histidine kinase
MPAEPVVVRGWEPGLRLVAENLLENAARHGRPGGRAVVRVEPAVDGVGPALTVEDDGPGVPEAERERVLAPFARVPVLDGDEERPGSGLGLALVAQQARHHGGDVEVGESVALGGARVSVRLGRAAQPG